MSSNMTELVAMLRDIFIAPYLYSDFDEDLDGPTPPDVSSNATSSEEATISGPRHTVMPATVSVERVRSHGEDEIQQVNKGLKEADSYTSSSRDEQLQGPTQVNQKRNAAKKSEDETIALKKQAARKFESELVRSSIHNILQKHILQATGKSTVSAREDYHSDLTQFHFFPRLPLELRFKIWKMATQQPRIIAIQSVPRLDSLGRPRFWPPFQSDFLNDIPRRMYTSGIHPRSRTPPLLHVNRESREEGMKYYEKRCLLGWPHSPCTIRSHDLATYYINIRCDIVMISYYGDKISQDAAWDFIQECELDFPRIAVDLSKFPGVIPHHAESDAMELMRDLHGIGLYSTNPTQRVNYPRGLKEIFFMVDSRLSPMEASEIGYTTNFRPAVIEGSTREQVNFKVELNNRIKELADENPRYLGPGTPASHNYWVGNDKPTISFVSLAPVLSCNAVYEVIVASPSQASSLAEFGPEGFSKLARNFGCEIQLPPPANLSPFPDEIGIKGSRIGVSLCKAAIQEVLDTLARIQNKNLANFDWIKVPAGA